MGRAIFAKRGRKRLIAVVATMVIWPLLAAVFAHPGEAAARKALVLGSSVTARSVQDSAKSVEQVLAERQGFAVTVVDDPAWQAMSEAQFRGYDEIIIGDPTCAYISSAALANLSTWAGAVMHSGGNRFVIGSDPQFHNSNDADNNRAHVVSDGISYAARRAGSTGVFLSTSCEADSNNVTVLNALSLSGTGWSVESPTCAGNIGIVASAPGFTTHDADLSDWFCSSHSDYPAFPSDWVPFAISADAPTKTYCANDVETKARVCGQPYILTAGGGVAVTSNITLTPATASEATGTNHTVTATVSKDDGSPLPGAVVTFTVSAGPNAGKTGTCTTPASGQCNFTYHDDGGAGTDTILGEFTDSGRTQQASASVTWGGAALPAITLTPATANKTAGTDHTVTATVSNGDGSPLSGAVVSFTVSPGPNAGKTGTCTTPASGQCSFTYHDDGGAGTDTIRGGFATSSGTIEASATVTWTAPPARPTKLVAEPTVARVVLDATTGRTYLTLAATLTTLDGVGVPSKTIQMYSGGVLCVTTTNAQGFATCGGLVPALQATLNGNYWATFFGDANYFGSSSKGPILIVAGTRIES